MNKMLKLPKDDVRKQEILQKIAQKFEKDRFYSEREVNEIIKLFNVEDYALVRRELVNFNYLGIDAYKGSYWSKKKILSDDDLDDIRAVQRKMKGKGVL